MGGLGVLPASAGSPGEPAPDASDVSVRDLSARALVLTIVRGPTISPPTQVAVLQCSPLVGGTHPKAREACVALAPKDGDVGKFTPPARTFCPWLYEPVTISAVGVWDDRFSLSSQTFGNSCLLSSSLGAVAGFASLAPSSEVSHGGPVGRP
ncbi:SSI family serine proteinase inhibitor [Streptosporangium vulgare]